MPGLTGHLTPREILQPHGHYGCPKHACAAKDIERILPSQFVANVTCQPACQNDAHIVGSLVDGHGACTRVSMILSQQGIVGRAEEGFPAAGGDGTGEKEHENAARQSREHGGYAPEQDAQGAHPFAGETVSHPAADGNHGGIEQVEENGDQAHGGVREIQAVPDERKYGIENLAVSLVEQESHPQQGQYLPFIEFAHTFHACRIYLWSTVVQKYEKNCILQ